MEISSTAFGANEVIPREYTCDGPDRSPPLQWTDPPEGTQSFALFVDDPDAPHGIFRHWGVYDLPANRRELRVGEGNQEVPDFRQATNDFGKIGYGGPCPPRGSGPHRYRFHLLALDVEALGVRKRPSVVQLIEHTKQHVLGSSVLTGRYERGSFAHE